MLRTLSITMLAFAFAFAPAALAGDELKKGKRAEMRERVEQKIQTYLTVELSSRMALDEKKSLKLSEAIKAQMKRKQERREKLKGEMNKLRDLVDKKAPDGQVKSQLDVVTGLAGRDEDMHDFLNDTSKFLTVQEQARLAIAFPEIMKDVHQLVREARGKRGLRGERGRGGFGGPDDGDEP